MVHRAFWVSIVSITVMGMWRAPARGQDLDGNGFPDTAEQALVDRFCPSLVLHSGDRRIFPVCPEPVEIVTGDVYDTWRDKSGESGYCGVTYRLHTPGVNYSALSNSVPDDWYPPEQTIDCHNPNHPLSDRTKHFDFAGPGTNCAWQSTHVNDQPTQPEGGWYKVYDEGTPPGGVPGTTGRGANFPHTVYAHPFTFVEDNQTQHVIQYWFFYPFNDWINNHEGDWEHVNVFLTSADPDSSQIEKVIFYFHERYKKAVVTQVEAPNGPFDCYVVDGTHVVVFVGGHGQETDCELTLCSTGAGEGSHGNYTMPGTWNNVNHRGYEDEPDGVGLWIPWSEIVDNDDSDRDGVVLLKETNDYNYDAMPWLSWFKADVLWGHPYVWSISSEHTGLVSLFSNTIGNKAPQGPAHQDTWNSPYGTDRFLEYNFIAPHPYASDANWSPPARMVVTFPGQNAVVTGELDIQGTIHYADEVTLEWGQGASPAVWSEFGMSVNDLPMVQSTIGKWNTGVVPSGTYTIRVRSSYGGQLSEAIRTISVTHQCVTVAQVGGDFATIQAGIDFAATGDTVRVTMGVGAYPRASITMKSGVYLVASGGPVRDIFGDHNEPTITISNHVYPCTIEGFTFRHDHSFPTVDGSDTEHGAKITGSSPVFRNCTFKYNVAERGGGVLVVASPGRKTHPIFEGCMFLVNRADEDGGGIAIEDQGTPPKTGEVGFDCIDCDFVGNYVAENNGGAAVSVKYIGLQNEPVTFTNCTFVGHDQSAIGADETTVLLDDAGNTSFLNCAFYDNGTTDLVRMADSTPDFDLCTFAKNYGADGVFGWVATQDGYPDVNRSIIAFNDGPVAVGSSDLTSLIELQEVIVYANDDQGRGPSDTAWDAAGTSIFMIDPAFCNPSPGNLDFDLYAFSPAAAPTPPNPGYFGERVGAFDVGCVPPAVVTVTALPTPTKFPSKPWIVVACPAGDLDALQVTVNLNGPITRNIDRREIVLDADGFDAGAVDTATVFDQSGFVEAQSDVVGPDYIATIEHSHFGGHGNDTVNILLNGHPLASQAHFEIRSVDMTGDGLVNVADFALFGGSSGYPSPPKPYNRYCDFSLPEYVLQLQDFAIYAAHNGHAKPAGSQQLNDEPAESSSGVALQFTEEFPTANTHRLYVDVSVEDFTDVTAAIFSMQTGSERLSFVNWIPAGGEIGEAMFSPVIRDGAEELFFGVLVSDAFQGSGATLGRLVFDVSGSESVEIGEDNFVLTIGEVLVDAPASGLVVASMEGVFARTLDPAVARVYHDRLEQNFPNPFNPTTTLAFSIKSAGNVNVSIYDVGGRRVRELVNERRERGAYKVVWDGQNDAGQIVASGVYFYKMTAGSFTDTKKMTILK